MPIEYERGRYVIGSLAMKDLEENGLAVVDAEDYLSQDARLRRLEASFQELLTANTQLQQALMQQGYEYLLQQAKAPDPAPAGTVISVRPGRRPARGGRKGAA